MTFILFLIVFSLVVVIHEMGHYLVARYYGIPVYEFSIGFPFSPIIFTFFKIGETSFTLRLLPLGGFVNFSKDASDEDALLVIPPYKRIFILAAGSVMNLVTGVFFLAVGLSVIKNLGFTDAFLMSIELLQQMIIGTLTFFQSMINHSSEMTGPVGIAYMTKAAVAKGIYHLIGFVGVISLALGVMNLMPIPALDGGHIVFALVEMITGKKINKSVYKYASVAGLFLFIFLTIVATSNDLSKFVLQK